MCTKTLSQHRKNKKNKTSHPKDRVLVSRSMCMLTKIETPEEMWDEQQADAATVRWVIQI